MRPGMACDNNNANNTGLTNKYCNISSGMQNRATSPSTGTHQSVISSLGTGHRTRRSNTLPRSSGSECSANSNSSPECSRRGQKSKPPTPPPGPLPKSPVIPFRASSLQKGLAKLTLRKRHGSGPPSGPSTPLTSTTPPSRLSCTPPPMSLLSPRGERSPSSFTTSSVFKNTSQLGQLGNKKGALLRRHSVDPEARRRANVGNQRSLDFYSESTHQNHLYLFRDPRDSRGGSLYGSNDPICDRLDFEELEENENLLYVKFFKFYRCYDLIPISAKLVVFDTQLLVKKAFYALVSNGVRAAPLWDSTKQGFVGMLTITDFINILRNYYKSSAAKMDELEEQKLEAWRNVLKDNARPIITIEPDACLLDAIKALIHNRVHRLPVIDPETGNVIYVLTHKRILKFLFAYFNDLPSPTYLNSTIKELNIGTYENIAVTTMETPLIKALHLFCEKRVSALPVVDEKGRVVDIYAKFDVINLAAEKIYSNLDITVKKALEHREHYFEGVITCKASDTLLVVLDKIFKNEVHRLVIVDDQDLVVGIVSLSDILSFLALKPLALERQEKKTENSDTLVEDSVKEAAEEEHSAQEAQEAENEEFDEATNYDQEEN